MGKIRIIIIVICLGVLLISVSAFAELLDNGNGTITDTDTGLMWLQDANYAYTSGYDTILDLNGRMYWTEAIGWANTLMFADYDDWRLPNADPTCHASCNNGNVEMAHLYYTELGNSYNGPLINTGPFINLQQDHAYWSQTVYPIQPSNDAYVYDFSKGRQDWYSKGASIYAMAVRDCGGSCPTTVVPEPISSTLFIVGGVTLGFRRFRKS